MKYTANIELTAEQICNLFVGAFEGGSNYWVQTADWISSDNKPKKGLVWWGQPEFFDGEFSFEIVFDVQKGIKAMLKDASGKRHFADFVSENDDATTADVFMQFVVLGEVVYG